MRTGNEPANARSALRLRFWLSLWGLLWAAFGTTVFSLLDRPGWAAACGVLFLVALVDLAVVAHHLHRGAHWQPGRGIPPYEPDHGGGRR